MPSKTLRFALIVSFMALCAGAAQAQVHHVDCNIGPHFDIQQGVNAAANGDIVVVHPCSSSQYTQFTVQNRNNLQIVGADFGGSVISAFPIGANSNTPNASPRLNFPFATCVSIRNSSNISIVGLEIEACGGNGFEIVSSRQINLHGNWLSFATLEGVKVVDSSSVSITGNHLSGSQLFGISTNPGSRFVKIEANRVNNNLGGIEMQGGAIDVINNEVRNNGATGIAVLSSNSKVSRNWSVGNFGPQLEFQNWALSFDNCVVGNWLGGAGLFPTASAFGCQSENF